MAETYPLFRKPCQFIAGAANLEALPEMTLPEVAFIGRSNVGKSTMINALVGHNKLARTSQNPGMTKQLNFFNIGDAVMFVDMPGYGYAKVSKTDRALWDMLIKGYLIGRANLKRTFVLVDSRRGMKESDDAMMDMLDEAAVSFQIVLTKCDAIKQSELDLTLENLTKTIGKHAAAHPEVVCTSAKKKDGIEELQRQIMGLVA